VHVQCHRQQNHPLGGLRKTKLIGRGKLTGQTFLSFATYNLVRMGSLSGNWGGSHV
jgi:hypothetical protein